LERKGISIGSMDLLIASHALSLSLPLVTNNIQEFKRIPGLRLENWV
jgi:tRNA(fMet)-specific endonuclease VapC